MPYAREIGIIAIVALCTFFTRFFPFALFGRTHKPPELVQYLGRILPAAVMAILVVYCLKKVSFAHASTFAPQLIAVSIVAALHCWKRNNLLSIGAGTVSYMLLIQLVFK